MICVRKFGKVWYNCHKDLCKEFSMEVTEQHIVGGPFATQGEAYQEMLKTAFLYDDREDTE